MQIYVRVTYIFLISVLFGSCNVTKFPAEMNKDYIPESITYRDPDSPSFKAKLIKLALRITVSKREIQKRFEKNQFNHAPAPLSKGIVENLSHSTLQVLNRNVDVIGPKEINSENIIIFLHGGGYMNNIRKQHWNFIEKLVEETGSTVYVPDYFLAPTYTYEPSFDMLDKLYETLQKEFPGKKIVLMGDSAGGGFALSFAEKLKVDQKQQAHQIILISPWLDVTNSNPEIDSIQPKDPFLKDTEGFRMAGKAYAGKTDPKNYLLSPIYGDFTGLPQISLFTATHETLYADAKKFKAMMDEKNILMNYYVYPELFHDFPMVVSLREAERVMQQISELLKN